MVGGDSTTFRSLRIKPFHTMIPRKRRGSHSDVSNNGEHVNTVLSRRAVLTTAGAAGFLMALKDQGPRDLVVSANGFACIGGLRFRCALGAGGVRTTKREGDGATPAGRWPLREVFYRADRVGAPKTLLSRRALRKNDGWCDAPADPRYNQSVSLPYTASAEALWRTDRLYDLIVVVGYNDGPVVRGAGSAIFLHIARKNYAPTAGCIAFKRPDLLRILSLIDRNSHVVVKA